MISYFQAGLNLGFYLFAGIYLFAVQYHNSKMLPCE